MLIPTTKNGAKRGTEEKQGGFEYTAAILMARL